MTRQELVATVAVGVLMVTSAAVWLWGPIPLFVVGGILLLAATFVDVS